MLWAVRVVQEGRWRDIVLAGVFAGLAGATKYPAALAAAPVGLAALLRWPTCRDPGLGLAAAAALLSFTAASPYVWLDAGSFWEDLTRMGREHLFGDLHAAPQAAAVQAGALYVLRVNLRHGLGVASLLAGIAALVWPWRWRRDEAVLLAGVLAFGLLALSTSSVFLRYSLPLAPLWSVLLWRLLRRLDGRVLWQLGCAALVLVEPAHAS